MATQIQTPRDLVDALGGVSKAATVLDEKYPSNISNWLKAGSIPSSKYLRHKAQLEKLGISAPSSLWFDEASA